MEEEISHKEERIRSITRIYYSKPAVQQALLEFSQQREAVPRYFEGFGKRPDTLTYPADVMNLVLKGATSFHASEELWSDPLMLRTEMSQDDAHTLRAGWDLLIDIDSPYFDYSRIAARLVIQTLERYGVTSYGIKFSGSKGFHIIVPFSAFPDIFEGHSTKNMFPEWPRAITSFLLEEIKPEYNKQISAMGVNFAALERRTKMSKEDLLETRCPNCSNISKKGTISILQCSRCSNKIERPNFAQTKRKLKCIDPSCPGYYELSEEKEFSFCESCGFSSYDKKQSSSNKVTYSKAMRESESNFANEFKEELAAEKLGSLDLVLVSPRHLFRMPYSLHEKTALASVVLSKSQLDSFVPKDADPMKVSVVPYYPQARAGEAEHLLSRALEWKRSNETELERKEQETRKQFSFENIDTQGITEAMFPAPIKKLLNGLVEGRKRGLFILITFLRALNFPEEYVSIKIRDWNKKNAIPLKEGYIKSQLDWHFRQTRRILPPNYSNPSFYKDLGLLDKEPNAKNPISEVLKKLRKSREE